MKTVIYESDHVYEATMPAIGKMFTSGEPVVLTDEQAEIALTNSSIRLVGDSPKSAASESKAPAPAAGGATPSTLSAPTVAP